jgi:hypothetical protein
MSTATGSRVAEGIWGVIRGEGRVNWASGDVGKCRAAQNGVSIIRGELLTSKKSGPLRSVWTRASGAGVSPLAWCVHGCAFCGQSVGEGRTPQTWLQQLHWANQHTNNASFLCLTCANGALIRAPRIVQGLQLVEHSVGGGCGPTWCAPWARTGLATPTAFGGYLSQDWRNLC